MLTTSRRSTGALEATVQHRHAANPLKHGRLALGRAAEEGPSQAVQPQALGGLYDVQKSESVPRCALKFKIDFEFLNSIFPLRWQCQKYRPLGHRLEPEHRAR